MELTTWLLQDVLLEVKVDGGRSGWITLMSRPIKPWQRLVVNGTGTDNDLPLLVET